MWLQSTQANRWLNKDYYLRVSWHQKNKKKRSFLARGFFLRGKDNFPFKETRTLKLIFYFSIIKKVHSSGLWVVSDWSPATIYIKKIIIITSKEKEAILTIFESCFFAVECGNGSLSTDIKITLKQDVISDWGTRDWFM